MKQHKIKALICMTLMSGSLAYAATTTEAKKTYEADKKAAATRYSADRKICASETESSLRMQCQRDAKTEYDKSLAAAKTKLTAASSQKSTQSVTCKECGKVTSVTTGERDGKGGPVGMIAGGVAGAVLGHQVGKGTGKDLATIAGAAGGAYAGHKIEQKMTKVKFWSVKVRFDSGEERNYEFEQDPGYKTGDAVKSSGNSIVRN